jgi:hypothetical protein
MERNSWKSHTRLRNQETTHIYGSSAFIALFTEPHQWSIRSEPDQSNPVITFIFSWNIKTQNNWPNITPMHLKPTVNYMHHQI